MISTDKRTPEKSAQPKDPKSQKNNVPMNILIVGVGGQGVLLASQILSEAALQAGYDVKKSEVHGMSQRGGVVSSHIRFGKKVHSPLIPNGAADVILAFERAEALRWIHELKPGGAMIVNAQIIIPPIAVDTKYSYPTETKSPEPSRRGSRQSRRKPG
jgi:indolepyruvate ferredoxin oxidoreductase beta subunit